MTTPDEAGRNSARHDRARSQTGHRNHLLQRQIFFDFQSNFSRDHFYSLFVILKNAFANNPARRAVAIGGRRKIRGQIAHWRVAIRAPRFPEIREIGQQKYRCETSGYYQ
jgi:hypothetical protein